MDDILFMMVFPFIAAGILLLVRNDRARTIITEVTAAVMITAAVAAAAAVMAAIRFICFFVIEMLLIKIPP